MLSFAMLGVVSLVFVESLFAKYSVGDGELRYFLPFLPGLIVGLPASLLSQKEQLHSLGGFLKRLFIWSRKPAKGKPGLPLWVRQVNWVVFAHFAVNFVLAIYVTGGAGGSVREANGHFFVASGECVVKDLTAEQAHLWLSFWVSLASSFFVAWF